MTKCSIFKTIQFIIKFTRLDANVQNVIIRTIMLEEKLSKLKTNNVKVNNSL